MDWIARKSWSWNGVEMDILWIGNGEVLRNTNEWSDAQEAYTQRMQPSAVPERACMRPLPFCVLSRRAVVAAAAEWRRKRRQRKSRRMEQERSEHVQESRF